MKKKDIEETRDYITKKMKEKIDKYKTVPDEKDISKLLKKGIKKAKQYNLSCILPKDRLLVEIGIKVGLGII